MRVSFSHIFRLFWILIWTLPVPPFYITLKGKWISLYGDYKSSMLRFAQTRSQTQKWSLNLITSTIGTFWFIVWLRILIMLGGSIIES
jgi:hypothetical protein